MLYKQLSALCLSRPRVSTDEHCLIRMRLQHPLIGAVGHPEDVGRLVTAHAHVLVSFMVLRIPGT